MRKVAPFALRAGLQIAAGLPLYALPATLTLPRAWRLSRPMPEMAACRQRGVRLGAPAIRPRDPASSPAL